MNNESGIRKLDSADQDATLLGALLDDAFRTLEQYANSASTSERWPNIRSGEREPIPWMQRRLVFERDGNCCRSCGRQANSRTAKLDHITPWSAGGSDCSCNLRVLCEPCNAARSNHRGGLDEPGGRPHVTLDCVVCAPRLPGRTEPYPLVDGLVNAYCGTCGVISLTCPEGIF